MSVSLRVPADVKKRVDRLARAQSTTPHAFMLEAIEAKVAAEEAQGAFLSEAERRLARMRRTGLGIPADEVFAHFARRAEGKRSKRPMPRKMP